MRSRRSVSSGPVANRPPPQAQPAGDREAARGPMRRRPGRFVQQVTVDRIERDRRLAHTEPDRRLADQVLDLRHEMRRGELILEQYYNGARPERLANVKSVSKSVISTLVGMAIERGLIKSVNEPIVRYFPQLARDPDPRKARITIEDLLTMRSGLVSTSFDNYGFVGHLIPIWRMVFNSLFVVAIAVPMTVLIASWAGFAIAASPRNTSRRLIVISVIALMVPAGALWIPRFAMFRWIGITDSPWPLVSPALMATTPFYVLLFALVYARIPKPLFDAARLEGLTPYAIWRRVAFPLGKPAAFAVAVLAFVFHWANFLDPLLYLSTPERFTLPLGLRALQTLGYGFKQTRVYPEF